MRPRHRLSALLALSSVVALLAGSAPGHAEVVAGPSPVVGGSTVAYRAEPYREPIAARAVTGTTLFLTGGDADELEGGQLSTTAPTGGADAVQVLQPARNDGGAPDSGAAFWRGPFRGRVSGPVRVTLHWTRPLTQEVVGFTGDNVVYQLVADPGTAEQRLIGVERTHLTMDTTSVTTSVDVLTDGQVRGELLLQVFMANFENQGYAVRYGSATAPSAVVLPDRAVARGPALTTTAVGGVEPLRLGASTLPRKAAEPTLGVTPAGTTFVTAAERVEPDGLLQTVLHASYDGGRTFVAASPVVAGQPFPPRTQDPYVHVDPVTGRVFTVDLLQACSVLTWSADEGRTWSPPNPLACNGGPDDHQTIVTGPPPAGVTTNGYPRVLYYCANQVLGTRCARSLDGGSTFAPAGQPAYEGVSSGPTGGGEEGTVQGGLCGGITGHAATDGQGRLYLPKGHCGRPWLAVSEDAGATWRHTLVSPVPVADNQTSLAVDSAGNAYYAFFDAVAKLAHLSVSRDGGRTFAAPLQVSPPGVAAVNFPTVDAGSPGVVALAFPSTRVADEASLVVPWDHHVVVSTDALSARPLFRAATSNPLSDPVHRGRCLGRCGAMLDFLDATVSPAGEVWAALVDTCTGTCTTDPRVAGDDARGVVVKVLDPAGTSTLPTPPRAAPDGALPATGGGLAPLGLAALLAAAALLTARGAARDLPS